MELVTLYNFQHIKNKDIKEESFDHMLDLGWDLDNRSNTGMIIIKKIFKLEDETIYRVMLRFSIINSYVRTYEMDLPTPFVVMRTEQTENNGYKDVEVFHGRKMKNVLGYLQAGIPIELFKLLRKDLRETLLYN